jgi:hypothetical protein
VVKVATPDALSVPVPNEVVPSRNVTLPVGAAVPVEPVVVEVKVTLALVATLVDDAARVVFVAVGAGGATTVRDRTAVVFGSYSVSPE